MNLTDAYLDKYPLTNLLQGITNVYHALSKETIRMTLDDETTVNRTDYVLIITLAINKNHYDPVIVQSIKNSPKRRLNFVFRSKTYCMDVSEIIDTPPGTPGYMQGVNEAITMKVNSLSIYSKEVSLDELSQAIQRD